LDNCLRDCYVGRFAFGLGEANRVVLEDSYYPENSADTEVPPSAGFDSLDRPVADVAGVGNAQDPAAAHTCSIF
jgi:hypothetical protein